MTRRRFSKKPYGSGYGYSRVTINKFNPVSGYRKHENLNINNVHSKLRKLYRDLSRYNELKQIKSKKNQYDKCMKLLYGMLRGISDELCVDWKTGKSNRTTLLEKKKDD